MNRALAATAALLVCLALAPSAHAALRFRPCPKDEYRCARLSVPIDRSGAVPGRVSLLIKKLRADGRVRRSPVVVLAGGPGQSATAAFGPDDFSELPLRFEHRELIVFDQRGTGRSGLLRCPALERAKIPNVAVAGGGCANSLGPRRAFYTTRDSVEDIEAIRRALGVRRLALFGTSYGTKVAAAYAARYSRRVERMLLDSVVDLDGPDPLGRDSFAATPRILRSLCARECGRITHDPVTDLERLIRRIASAPLRGAMPRRTGRGTIGNLGRTGVFEALVNGDFDWASRAEFPAAVRSALRGDASPLLRLKRRALDARLTKPAELSAATFAATTCEESDLPWDRATPFGERRREAGIRMSALPAASFRPFDFRTAFGSDLLRLCELWPASKVPPTLDEGALPSAPVLMLAGEDDVRTPVEGARRLSVRFPRAQVLVVPGTGHPALDGDFSSCSGRAFDRFFAGRSVTRRCPAEERLFTPSPIDPMSLREVRRARGVPGLRGRAVGAVAATLDDLLIDFGSKLFTDIDRLVTAPRGLGLRAGRYALVGDFDALRLRGVEYVPGVRISGTIRVPFERGMRGRLRISGPGTPDGTIRIRRLRVTGRIGGRRIVGLLPRPGAYEAHPERSEISALSRRAARRTPLR